MFKRYYGPDQGDDIVISYILMPKSVGGGLVRLFRAARSLFGKLFKNKSKSLTTDVPPGIVYNPDGKMTWGETGAVTAAVGTVTGGGALLNVVPMIALTNSNNDETSGGPPGGGNVMGTSTPVDVAAPIDSVDYYDADNEELTTTVYNPYLLSPIFSAPRRRRGRRKKRIKFL